MLKLFISNFKILVRDKQFLFWSFMFPLIFTVIFGFFFGSGNMNAGNIALINRSNSPLAKSLEKTMTKSDLFKVQKETNLNTARDLMKKNKVAAIVVIPENFAVQTPQSTNKITVINDPANSQTNSILISFINGFLTQASFKAQNAQPLYSVAEEKTNTNRLNYFDFVLIGLVGMSLMNSSINGIGTMMAKYREDKILKRITTTPLPSWKFIVSYLLARLVINIAQITLILLVGVYAFDAHIYGNIPLLFLFAILGAILFQLMGFVVAGFSKTTEAAEGMATAITIPMMFLAGVFFPIDQLPKWLFSIVQYLPLAPLLKMIRSIALEAASPLENPINIVIVLGWIIVSLFIASYKFRLNEE